MPAKESEPRKEPEATPYLRAARYATDVPAYRAYSQAQDLLFSADCDLSAYRLRYQDVPHVVIVGASPPSDVDRKLTAIFKDGQPATLPPDIVRYLARRRSEAKTIGPWVEGHYRPGRTVRPTD
jgi:hypothetical protein